jgi:hypothetical protein
MQEKTKMTIHRALSELKLIDAKITKAMQEFTPLGLQRGSSKVNDIHPLEDFSKESVSKYNKITDLMNQKVLIKKLIVDSNAKTRVKINNVEMTVADAITAKDLLKYKENLLSKLENSLRQHEAAINKHNENF